MAKPLNERISTALTNARVRTHDIENLITEIEAEQERAAQARAALSIESVDFALSEEDRDEAAAKAEKYRRTADMLANALDKLRERLVERRESENSQAAEAERKAALAERDKIAAEFDEFLPPALDRLVDLLRLNEANADRMKRAGLNEPTAEAKARGVTGFLGYAGEVESYAKIKIPTYDKPGRMWPVDAASAVTAAVSISQVETAQRQREAEKKRKEAAAARAEEHAEKHGYYRLSTNLGGEGVVRLPAELVTGSIPKTVANWEIPWEGEIAHETAAKLADVPHLTVKRLEDPAPSEPFRGSPIVMGSF